MLRRGIAGTFAAAFLLAAAGCGDTGERISEEEAGVGPEPGFEVLVDTAATPPGGVPGMTPGGASDTGAAGGG